MNDTYAGKSPMERGDHDVEHESGLLTIKWLSEELRMYAGRPEGIHVDPSAFSVWADAIDANLAKAAQGEAVAEVRHFNYSGIARNGFSQEAVLLDSAPTMPEGTKLYAALAHPRPVGVTDGYRLVPVEPTKAMLVSGRNENLCCADDADRIYAAMLAAAPDGEVG